jgi:hypothetical protein
MRSATKGVSRNISRLNSSAPGTHGRCKSGMNDMLRLKQIVWWMCVDQRLENVAHSLVQSFTQGIAFLAVVSVSSLMNRTFCLRSVAARRDWERVDASSKGLENHLCVMSMVEAVRKKLLRVVPVLIVRTCEKIKN